MHVFHTLVRSRLHTRLWVGVLLCGLALFISVWAGIAATKTATAADNNGTSVTYMSNGAGIRIVGENWAGRGWYSPTSPDGLADLENPSHIILGKTSSNPVTYSGRVQQSGAFVGSNSQPCAFTLTIEMTSSDRGTVSGNNGNLGGDCNATTIADLGLPATFRVSGDLPPEFGNVNDDGVASGNNLMATRWSQGDTREITYATIDLYTESEIREVCRILGDADSPHHNANAYELCLSNALAAREAAIEGGPEYETSCAVEGIGWIVCPVMNFLSGVADGAYSLIENFLVVNVRLLDRNTGTYAAWTAFRNIANILFVIMFLIIIYSQLTSMGISNYGVKKALPRLVVAAVLVNTSFFICQLMVDITQIIGGTLASFIGNIPTGFANAEATPTFSDVIGDILMGSVVGVVAAVGIIGGVAVLALSISIPVLLAFLIAVLMTVIILIGRQAAIVIMIVLAPVAFVAYLLPNTEQWFRRWIKMFWGLLLVYPIVALLYAGGKLAGNIIVNAANADGVDAGTKFWMSLVGMGAAAIPLIMTPSLLRGAMNATGTLGTKLSAFGNKTNSRVGGRVKDSTQLGRRVQEFNSGRERARTARAIRNRNSGLGRGIDSAIGVIPGASTLLGTKRGTILSEEAEEKLFDDEVSLEQKSMKGDKESDWLAMMNDVSKTEHQRAAAAGLVMKSGSRKAQLAAIKNASNLANAGDAHAKSIQKQMHADMSGKPFGIGQSSVDALRQGNYKGDIDVEFNSRLENKLSPESLAGMDPDEIERARDMANDSKLSPDALRSLASSIRGIRSNDILNAKVGIESQNNAMFDEILSKAPEDSNEQNQTNSSSGGGDKVSGGGGSRPNVDYFPGGEETTDSGIVIPRGSNK